MEDAAYRISNSIITLAFLCAAARLLHRSLRTRAAPERLLGASFLLWGLSYPLSNPWWWLEWVGSVIPMLWLVFYPPDAYRRWINRSPMPHARVA